jgi:serine/threonine protein kinase/tetratricopeptide (TPR) repeat protein
MAVIPGVSLPLREADEPNGLLTRVAGSPTVTSMALTQGSHLGPYEITAVIGSGGMGDVYRARDHRLGRDIAIKVVSEATARDPVSLERFTREAHAVAALNHPHIVTIYSTEEAEGVRFITMELIEGRTLARMIPEGGLSLAQFFDVSIAIADALSAAHHKHITHRDLTPVNVMVTGEGLVKVLDFGLARGGEGPPSDAVNIEELATRSRLTGAGTILGTMPYMSPEQIEAKPLDQRTDIFSFGIVMYEMATGGRPFRGDTKPGLMSSIMREHPRPVSELRRDLPADLSRLISRCLEKDPRDRVQTAHEILLELRTLRRAWESGATAPAARRAATSPWSWAAVAVLVLALLPLVVLRGQRPDPAAASPPAMPSAAPVIVVLPFENVTRDPEDEAFAEGLLVTLTSSLTQLERFPRSLRVIPWSEVRSQSVSSAGDAWRVFRANLAINGSIQRLPAAARLTLNLIDASAGQVFQLASQTIDITKGSTAQAAILGALTALLTPRIQLPPDAGKAMSRGGSEAPSAFMLFTLGRGYLNRFDHPESTDQAIDAFKQAVAADPRYAVAHAALGEAYWRKHQDTRDTAWLQRADDEGQKALASDNRLASVHVSLAMVARGRGRYEQAVAFAQTAVDLDPKGGDGYRELGGAYEKLGQLADAEATYRKAVAIQPNDWLAYNMLGNLFLVERRLPEAEASFRRAIAIAPGNTKAFNNLGVTFSAMGRTGDAEAAWLQSMSIRPNSSAASNLATTYYTSGRYKDAAPAYEKAIALGSGSYRVWGNLGAALHWSSGDKSRERAAYTKAVALAEEARRLNPRDADTLAGLADYYSILGRRPEALAAAQGVERLHPRDSQVLYTVANAYEQMGDRDRALQWLGKAIAAGHDLEQIQRSPWLESLRKDKRFVQMMNKQVSPTNTQ